MRPILILRPEPGAGRSAARARALGLDSVLAPIFTVEPRAWDAPDASAFDAVLLTSGNAARLGGEGLERFMDLPAFAVGEATAQAAREAGFARVEAGSSDMAAALELAESRGARALFHPCGEHHLALGRAAVRVERRIVYASRPESALPPQASEALAKGALALLHSPRAAAHFEALCRAAGLAKAGTDLALISQAAAAAAGEGWRSKWIASSPRDHALLELAAKLCKTGAAPNGK